MELKSVTQNQLAYLLCLIDGQVKDGGVHVFYQMQDRNAAIYHLKSIDANLHADSIYMVLDFSKIEKVRFQDAVRTMDLTYSQYASNGQIMLLKLMD